MKVESLVFQHVTSKNVRLMRGTRFTIQQYNKTSLFGPPHQGEVCVIKGGARDCDAHVTLIEVQYGTQMC